MKFYSKIVFLGGNRYKENGPLCNWAKLALDKGYDVEVLTDQIHLDYPTNTYNSFQEQLDINKICYRLINNPNEELLKYEDPNYLILNVHCNDIFNKKIIEKFNGRLFNYHSASLPEQKGAGCHSWRLMQNISQSRLTWHLISEKIDEGEIVLEKNIKFPSYCSTPEKVYEHMKCYENKFFSDFLEIISSEELNKFIKKDCRKSFYWPSLKTDIHGFINWDWEVNDIQRFCAAFDEPFKGAQSFINNKKVWLKDTEIDDLGVNFHPFQFGLIYRKYKDQKIWVASKGGGLVINKFISDDMSIFRLGKRLDTPQEYLQSAKRSKALE